MIKIDYIGRSGNNLFQWVFARLIQHKYGLGIITDPPESVAKAKTAFGGMFNDCDEEVIDDTRGNDKTLLDRDYVGKSIRLHGYFQDATFYNPYREQIKEWFELPTVEKNTDDLVIHLRLTDYWWHRVAAVIHPSWYFACIQKEPHRKLYVVVEPHETNSKYLGVLKNKYPKMEVVSQGAKEDFEFLMSFDRIICSNSTFAWWAAFLSNASKIYTFKPWMRKTQIPLANMVSAKVINGTFYNDVKLAAIEWFDYWNKQ